MPATDHLHPPGAEAISPSPLRQGCPSKQTPYTYSEKTYCQGQGHPPRNRTAKLHISTIITNIYLMISVPSWSVYSPSINTFCRVPGRLPNSPLPQSYCLGEFAPSRYPSRCDLFVTLYLFFEAAPTTVNHFIVVYI